MSAFSRHMVKSAALTPAVCCCCCCWAGACSAAWPPPLPNSMLESPWPMVLPMATEPAVAAIWAIMPGAWPAGALRRRRPRAGRGPATAPKQIGSSAATTKPAPKQITASAPAPPAPANLPSQNTLRSRLILASVRHEKARQARVEKRLAPPDPAATPELSDEERQVAHLKTMLDYRESIKKKGILLPPIELPLLDHAIPYAVGFRARREYPSVAAAYAQFLKNMTNEGKNAFAMRHIAVSDSFPGVKLDRTRNWFSSLFHYARGIFQAQSLKSTSWVAPMRQEMLEQYIKLNTAVAQDSPRITALTMPPFRADAAALARARPAEHRYVWAFHREVTPTRILSLRAADGAFDKALPASGTRVGVQALVRFDTEQSVEIYDTHGRALHAPAPTAEAQPPPPPPTPLGSGSGKPPPVPVPAARRRVTEYLVLDKAMYELGAQWRFRARFVPAPGRTVAV
ncbi:hypothetical protein B0H17DRAFT_1074797 [Mycena rosella]|uniref:Uncharacterized protein n=1 Tax=Mycena rosella TaxID=1033263 RepID=A0AAD7D7Q6_MYCRO|nr:hypothetical protein B0H17DRAFT_1074797 [Mycena rosella]